MSSPRILATLACAALACATLALTGCYAENDVFLVSPVTGETITCNGNYGRSSYLLTQFTGNQSATRQCAATYAEQGFIELN